jgi:hypothetical protein
MPDMEDARGLSKALTKTGIAHLNCAIAGPFLGGRDAEKSLAS